MFKTIWLSNWRQFRRVEMDFHKQLTVIAGANGAGKSTVLRLLSMHFGFESPLLATPLSGEDGQWTYSSGLKSQFVKKDQYAWIQVGYLGYSNGEATDISVPASSSGVQYSMSLPNQQSVPGLFISSHRPASAYRPISSIPTNAISAQQAYQDYHAALQNIYGNSYTQFSPTYKLKEAIISMATFGPGNAAVSGNPELKRTFDDFCEMLSLLMPESIGFESISIRIPDVVLVTRTGEFVLDSASGGLSALIDLGWQIFLYSRNRDNFSVVIDEPENHLHPTMQRSLLPNLMRAFPQAQFIVATHSPFIVTSSRDSFVYVLTHGDDNEAMPKSRSVTSVRLDMDGKAASASDVLRTVLGVPVTLPIWAENDLNRIASSFSIHDLDAAMIAKLRDDLNSVGLGEFYPQALTKIADQK